MRYLRYAFLGGLAVVLVCVALANRSMVTLSLLPDGVARLIGLNRSIELPLFVVIFAGIVAGLLIGFFWEWLREHKHRAEASRQGRQVRKLEREVSRLKGQKTDSDDDVLALLDETG